MPNAKVLEEKKATVAELVEKINNASAGVLVNYKGITVTSDTKLRRELRDANVEYAVIKNSILRFAFKETGFDALDDQLHGTTAIAISHDPVIAAKIIDNYASKVNPKDANPFTIKAGFVEGKIIDAAGVSSLAKLPSKEVLIATVLAGFNAPITGLVNVLQGNIRGLAVALGAIAAQKGAQE